MPRFWIPTIAVCCLQLALSTVAGADSAAEKYVDDALPYMYQSCESVVAEASGDDDYIDKVIRSLVAVSLYNRDVDTSWFTISDDEKTALHDKFVEALQSGCEADKKGLLAGVIDQAVAKALAGKLPK